jgi:hypothetical protein
MPADGYGGAIWQSLSSKACRKRKREGCAMETVFWTLDDRSKGASPVASRQYGSRTNEAGVKRKSLDRPLLI